MACYSLHGLNISSSIELVGCKKIPSSIVDLQILEGNTPDRLIDDETGKSSIQMKDSKTLVQTSDSGRFLIEGNNKIRFEKHPHATYSDIATLLTGVVLSIVLYKRHKWALHASAIEYNGKAILFCGSTGTGKSILAAALLKNGAKLISDNVTCIELDGNTAYALPGSTNLCLWPDSIEALSKKPEDYFKLRPTIEKRSVDARGVSRKIPIETVFLINRSQKEENAQESLNSIKPYKALAKLEKATCFRTAFKTQDPKFPFFEEAIQLTKKANFYSLNRLRHNLILEKTIGIVTNCLKEGNSDA